MSNRFSFLENSTTLINNLISFNENASLLKYISKLINDLTELLNESKFYDVEIKVGVEQDDIRIFKVHSAILRARSSYFKAALSNDWNKKSDNGTILFEKENISPKIFEVLLM